MMKHAEDDRPWQTKNGDVLTWAEMKPWHLVNAAQFLKRTAKTRAGLLPGIASYVGDDCGTARAAARLARKMERFAKAAIHKNRKNGVAPLHKIE